MNTAKQNAARPGRVKAACTISSNFNHSTQPTRAVIIEKNAFEEIRIGVNEYIGRDYIDVRVYSIRADRRVPTKKGIMIPLALLPDLIEGLSRAQADADISAQG